MTTTSDQQTAARDALERRLDRFAQIYDPAVHMTMTSEGLHSPAASLQYAMDLIDRGQPEDLERAGGLIEGAISCQIRTPGAYRYGNWRAYLEHQTNTNLTNYDFILDTMSQMLMRPNFSKLSETVRAELADSIEAGFVECMELNTPWHYTNINLMMIANLVIGGEQLGPRFKRYVDWGYDLLKAYLERSASNGTVFEYNSPPYTGIQVGQLARLATFCADPLGRALARILEERLWIHAGMRIHPGTKKQAGPWSRARYPQLRGNGGGTGVLAFRATGDAAFTSQDRLYPLPTGAGWGGGGEGGGGRESASTFNLPDYVRNLFLEKPLPYSVQEIGNRVTRPYYDGTEDYAANNDITTYLTDKYALGTSARTYSEDFRNEVGYQTRLSKSLMLHYQRPMAPGFGMLYSLYTINDVLPVDNFLNPRQTPDKIMDEKGFVRSVQHQNKAIVLYHPPSLPEFDYTSLRTMITVVDRSKIDELRVNEQLVTSLPVSLTASDTVFISDGGTYIALMPLEPTHAGIGGTPEIEIAEDGEGNLMLSIYNYRGPETIFPEFKGKLNYYRANMKSGFVIEVSSSSEVASFDAFRQHIGQATITDTTDTQFVRDVAYESGGDRIAIEVDLRTDDLLDRVINGVPYEPPYMAATTAVSSDEGEMAVLGATLTTEPGPAAWLLVDQQLGAYVASTPSMGKRALRLDTPGGVVTSPGFGCCRIAYYPGADARLDVLADPQHGPLYFTKPSGRATVMLNGVDVTSQLTMERYDRAEMLCLPARAG